MIDRLRRLQGLLNTPIKSYTAKRWMASERKARRRK